MSGEALIRLALAGDARATFPGGEGFGGTDCDRRESPEGGHASVRLSRNDNMIRYLSPLVECHRAGFFSLPVIFAKNPADGNPDIDKAENRYYTTNINLHGHCSAILE